MTAEQPPPFEPNEAPREPETIGESAHARAATIPPLPGGSDLRSPLKTRVEPNAPARIRPVAVRSVFLGAAAVLSSAFIFAFIVMPNMRAEARARAAPENQRTPPGSVRPADVLSDGPVTYADLTKTPEHAPEDPPAIEKVAPAQPPSAGSAHPPRVIVQRASRAPGPTLQPRVAQQTPREPRGPGEAERARRSSLFFDEARRNSASAAVPAASPNGAAGVTLSEDYDQVYGDRAVLKPVSPYELKAGAVIPAALLTGVDTEREGRVLAVVTENVFDTVTGAYLLIPQGARLIGRFDGDQTYSERRAFLVWERLLFPDGRSVTLNREPGVDSTGAGGVRGRVDQRLPHLALATVFAGAITTLGEVARRDGEDKDGSLLGDVGDAAAIEAARAGGRLIDRELEVKPIIRINQGARVQVLLTRDLILEPVP